MRLYEILTEYEFPQAKTRHTKNVPDLYDYEGDDAYFDDDDEQPIGGNPHVDNPDIETLGTGAFATAYRHKKNPYDVTKGSKASKEPDGFKSFFDALSKNEDAQSNPYFPRFRSMSSYHGQNDRQSYIARMEPLEQYVALSGKERQMLVNKLFGEHGIDIINHYFEEENRNIPWRGKDPTKEQFQGEKLAFAVQNSLENDTWADELRWQIEDKKFLQAIEFLQDAAKKYDFDLDMHYNNLMVRRTSVGPQLVFNDPFGASTDKADEEEIEGHPDWE